MTATAADVRRAMSGEPSDSAVRTLLSRLEAKKLVVRRADEQAYVYAPAPEPQALATSALQRLVATFFNGSAASAATALLGLTNELKPEELEALKRAIEEAEERRS